MDLAALMAKLHHMAWQTRCLADDVLLTVQRTPGDAAARSLSEVQHALAQIADRLRTCASDIAEIKP